MKTKTTTHNRTCGKKTIITVISAVFALSIQHVALACPQVEVVDPKVSSNGQEEFYFTPQNSYCTGPDCKQKCDSSSTTGTESIYQWISGGWVYTGDNVANSIAQAVNDGACIEG